MDDKCFYCGDTGYIHTDDDIPDQMCPNCEIGQAVIKGFNAAREIGIQACETLEAAKNEQIKELEAGQLDFAKETTRIHKTKIQRIEELEIAKTIGIQACDLLKERIEELEEQLDDYHNTEKFVLGDDCPTDENHCGCVMILKKRIKEIEIENRDLRLDLLKIDAYCRANDIDIEQALKGK